MYPDSSMRAESTWSTNTTPNREELGEASSARSREHSGKAPNASIAVACAFDDAGEGIGRPGRSKRALYATSIKLTDKESS